MKIAIITLYLAGSPGTNYQAIGTIEALKKLGYECSFISNSLCSINNHDSFRFDKLLKNRRRNKQYIKNTILYLINTYPFAVHDYPFEDTDYDLIVVGSDWLFDLNNCGSAFFLKNKTIPVVSFSTSFGTYVLTDSFDKNLLSGFKSISIREKCDSEMLNRQWGLKTRFDLDPTFLLTKEEWTAIIPNYKPISKKYILVFGTTHDDVTLKFAKKLAKKNGWKVILTNYWGNRLMFGTRIINKKNCLELLGLIKDAQCVVSHSFHCFVMSIIFNVNVYYAFFNKSHSDERFKTIIDCLHLDNHNILDNDNLVFSNYDYEKINGILQKERERSIRYLQSFRNYK